MISWLTRKQKARKPTQQGYRRPPDNGDQGTKHLHHKKASDKEKLRIALTQPDVVVVMDATTGHKTTKRTKKGIRTA